MGWSVIVALAKERARRVKLVACAGLFFLVGTLFPIVTWVALFAALRGHLLQAMRRAGYAVLSFVVGTLFAMKQLALVRRISYILLFFLIALLMPVLIWLGLAVAIHSLLKRWRESRLASALICRFDMDCPPGYVCIAGRCMPRY